jgi:hypothetical protein
MEGQKFVAVSASRFLNGEGVIFEQCFQKLTAQLHETPHKVEFQIFPHEGRNEFISVKKTVAIKQETFTFPAQGSMRRSLTS